MRRARPEAQIQRAVLDHLRIRAVPNCFFFHCPNGEWRSRITGAILKGQGVVAGVPDLLLIHGGRVYGLELKSANGRTTDVQRETHARMREAGAIVSTAWGLDEALAQLDQWQLLRGAALRRLQDSVS
jgi:hypothetical protein